METSTGRRAFVRVVFVVRTVLNASFRIIYPFLPAIARGLGISIQAAGGLITLRLAAGALAPFIGPLTDRLDRRRVMEAALLIFVLACLLLTGVGTVAATAVALLLFGLSKVLYDPAMHAYVSDAVPYSRRGHVIGTIELSWSSAWLLGVPAAGVLIDRLGWRAPWAALAGLGLISLVLTRRALPPMPRPQNDGDERALVASMLTTAHRLLRQRPVALLLLAATFLTLGNEIPFIVYGPWLEATFDLSLTTLGLASTVIGLAEAAAELGVTVIIDRLGKRRSVIAGLLALAASLGSLLVLPRLGLAGALIGLTLMMFSFEFSLVSLLTMATEQVPGARASFLSLIVTTFSMSRVAGTLLGSWLWAQQSFALHIGLGIACALIAVTLLSHFHEPATEQKEARL